MTFTLDRLPIWDDLDREKKKDTREETSIIVERIMKTNKIMLSQRISQKPNPSSYGISVDIATRETNHTDLAQHSLMLSKGQSTTFSHELICKSLGFGIQNLPFFLSFCRRVSTNLSPPPRNSTLNSSRAALSPPTATDRVAVVNVNFAYDAFARKSNSYIDKIKSFLIIIY